MATIAEQLTSLANTKTAIKDAIVAKGVAVADTDPFSAYAGKIGQISGGGGAPATKFGVSIDDLLGDVDANGEYSSPTTALVLNLSGVQSASYLSFARFAQGLPITELLAEDMTKVEPTAFSEFAQKNESFKKVSMNSLVETNTGAFQNAFPYAEEAHFNSLRQVTGRSTFSGTFGQTVLDLDQVFPNLERISGESVLGAILKSSSSSRATIRLSKVQTIIGSSSYTDSTFGSMYADIYLPSCTHVEKYICHTSRNNTLHFAAANQAAIEACDGYSYMFGAKEIYFDL